MYSCAGSQRSRRFKPRSHLAR